MFCSHKCQRIENFPQGMSIITWLRSVQQAGYFWGNIETKTATTPRAKSRSALQAKLAALEMRAHPKDADIEKYWLIFPGVNKIETQWRNSIPSSVPLLGWGDAPRHSVC